MTVEEKIKNILSEKCYKDDIQDDNRLRADLSMDSLSLVELMLTLEGAFGIEFDTGDLSPAGLIFVSDIAALVMKYVDGEIK